MLASLTVFTALVAFIGADCPRRAIAGLDADSCYVYKTFSSWFDAEDYCVGQNGQLASGHDAFTNSFLTQLPKELSSTYLTGVGIGGRFGAGSSTNWTWSHGSAVDYTNWAKGRPLIREGRWMALSADSEKWWTEDCFSSRPYICKVSAVKRGTDPPKTTCPPARLACPSGWTYFNVTDQCYKAFHHPYITRTDANKVCKSANANLVSIHNYEEHLFVQEISASGVPMQWTHGHFDAGVWIGLTDAAKVGTFRCSDGSPLDYEHWGPTAPRPIGPSCAEIFSDRLIGYNPDPWYNHWDNEECEGFSNRGFVCKRRSK